MFSFLFLFVIVLAVLIPVSVYAAIPDDVLRSYPTIGLKTGTAGAALTAYIHQHGNTQLNLMLIASGGNFNSTNLVIAVSEDNSTFTTVDTLALSTATTKGVTYSDASKGTGITLNAAAFPFIKVTTSAGVGSVTEKLYYVGSR